ncbi:hypothetical protein QPK31_22955, partial [Massilia sp. YIM B02769]|nr:hypothetical protein [Massilia sp. YIM B02769]
NVASLSQVAAPAGTGAAELISVSLDAQRHAGEVAWLKFVGVKLRLADNTFYTPDSAVMLCDGTLEIHEVKGSRQDDARVEIKIAADMYPMCFIAVQARTRSESGGWTLEVF